MIFMLFSIMWGRIQEQTTNFEHLVHETWPRTCGRVVFKFYKKQTKSKNHKTCQDVMISYVEAVIKIWEGFAQVVTYDACKPKNLRRSFMLFHDFMIVHIFWTACGCVGGVSFHGLLRSEIEFWHHLPIVLQIHTVPSRMCIWRTAGRCCQNSISDRSRARKLTLHMHPCVGLWPILTY